MQGIAELFPVSSLGHSVLLPAWVGGSWARDLNVSSPESPYLAFIVGLHVATALALIAYFWRDWVRIIRGLVTSIVRREVADADQRLAWLLILATIPVGLVGLLAEHWFRTTLAKPTPTAIFLMVNGVVLLGPSNCAPGRSGLSRLGVRGRAGQRPDLRSANRETTDAQAVAIGSAQILALAPGISRSGVTMVTGLLRGLSREDAARFSFLLATPVILAAGALKLGDLSGPLGDGIRGQVLFGSAAVRSRGVPVGSVPDPVPGQSLAAPVRRLLPPRRRGQFGAVRGPLMLRPRSAVRDPARQLGCSRPARWPCSLSRSGNCLPAMGTARPRSGRSGRAHPSDPDCRIGSWWTGWFGGLTLPNYSVLVPFSMAISASAWSDCSRSPSECRRDVPCRGIRCDRGPGPSRSPCQPWPTCSTGGSPSSSGSPSPPGP